MDPNQFIQGRNAKTLEELAPYVGQWVAWSEDGRRILAHAPELELLYREIDRRGLRNYIVDSIPPPEEGFLGGSI